MRMCFMRVSVLARRRVSLVMLSWAHTIAGNNPAIRAIIAKSFFIFISFYIIMYFYLFDNKLFVVCFAHNITTQRYEKKMIQQEKN